jgi:hypothetical protein
MKGYVLPFGYMGWVEKYGRYMMFATEDEYKEWMEDCHDK